jgi:hypothetical protein
MLKTGHFIITAVNTSDLTILSTIKCSLNSIAAVRGFITIPWPYLLVIHARKKIQLPREMTCYLLDQMYNVTPRKVMSHTAGDISWE